MQNVAPTDFGGRKANLVKGYRLGTVEVKTRNVQACSLLSMSASFSGKGQEKLNALFSHFTAT